MSEDNSDRYPVVHKVRSHAEINKRVKKRKETVLEKDIEKPVKAYGKKCGMMVRKYRTPANRSAPDDIFMMDQLLFFIEFKKPGEEATRAQALEHIDMRKAGQRVFVVDDIELGKRIIDDMLIDGETAIQNGGR